MTHSQLQDFTNKSQLPRKNSSATVSIVKCHACQQANSSERQFCTNCGEFMWRKCLRCGTECAGSEMFCGHCGANYREDIATRLRSIDDTVQRAQTLRKSCELAQAIALLRSIGDLDCPELRSKLAEARQLAEEIASEQARFSADAEAAQQDAERLIATHRFKDALIRLQDVPPTLRTDRIEKLLRSAAEADREIKSLRTSIAADIQARCFLELGPRIDRLLALQPNDEKVKPLAARVRDLVNSKVREAIKSANYAEARQLLERIPLSALDDTTQQLQTEVSELNRLFDELKYAPHVNETLLVIAKRLQQLAPQDAKVPKIIDKLSDKLRKGPVNQRFPTIPWAPSADDSQFGVPVDWIAGFKRLRGTAREVDETLRKHSGSFFVAAGLALQGLGLTPISMNLLPPAESAGLWNRLGRFRKTVPTKCAWGLDIGSHALKVIKLEVAETSGSEAHIVVADYFPHRLNLAAPAAEPQSADIVRESLQLWRDRYQPREDEVICVNASTSKMIARFFNIPSVSDGKAAEIVTNQLSQSLPCTLSDLNWDYQLLGQREEKSESRAGELRPVVAIAMRSSDVREQMEAFDRLGIPLKILQAESLALHTVLSYEHQPGISSSSDVKAPERIALWDVGSDSANLVVSSKQLVWFRTLRHAGSAVNQALISEFNLTFGQAEEIKRRIEKARRLGPLLETLDQTLSKLVAEAQRTLEAYRTEFPDQPIDRLWLCGGAAHQYGLLRQCRLGLLQAKR